jgi:hypothetical protein
MLTGIGVLPLFRSYLGMRICELPLGAGHTNDLV